MSKTITSISLSLACLAAVQGASGWELVYVPVNPNFGGNPINGSALLGNAQSQDKYKDPEASKFENSKSSLDDFNQMLQRSILSRISSAVSSSVVSSNGKMIPGTVETTDFTITIGDLGGGVLQITTTDKISGQSTSFQISQ